MLCDELQGLYDSVDEYKFCVGSGRKLGRRKCTCTLSYEYIYGGTASAYYTPEGVQQAQPGIILHWTLRQRKFKRVLRYTQCVRRVYRKPSNMYELAEFLLPDLVNIVSEYLAGYILQNDSDTNLVQEVVNRFRQLGVHIKEKLKGTKLLTSIFQTQHD